MASKSAINRNAASTASSASVSTSKTTTANKIASNEATLASTSADAAPKENMDATRTDTAGADAIKAAKSKFAAAQASGDKEGMKAAHDEAQSVRAKYNYTANSDGSEFSELGSTTNKATNASNTSASSKLGTYTIGSTKGVNQYNTMKSGDTFTATDGWTWKKNADGTATATRGNETANIVVKPSTNGIQLTGNIYQTTANGTPSGYGVGDLIVTNGGTYVIEGVNTDGTYRSSKYDGGTTLKNYKGSYSDGSNNNTTNSVTSVTSGEYIFDIDGKGNVLRATDKNGNAIDFSTIKAGVIGTGGGNQYLKTSEGNVVKISNTTPHATKYNPDTDSWENIDLGEIYFGSDNLTYMADGTLLKDWLTANQYNAGDYAVKLGDGNYWDLTGTKVPDSKLGMNALETKENTFEGVSDNLIESLFSSIINTPTWEDGNILTYEQALARAKERLTPEYDAEIEDTLDDMNRAAVTTGFYGQLPTEALKQQTAASIELEKAAAIQELANDLIDQSIETEEKRYDAEYQSSQARVNNIYQIYNNLWTQKQQEIENEQKDKELNMSQSELDTNIKVAQQEAFLNAVELYERALDDGYGSNVLGYLTKLGLLS